MPELPEVHALALFLADRVVGDVVAGVDVAAFSVLKTVDPPHSAVAGLSITRVARQGKFLDVDIDGLHLVIHLARAGWLRWRDGSGPPVRPARPGKGPLALRVRLASGASMDLTEAGTQKRLAVYLVRDPADVPGVAALGRDPSSRVCFGTRSVSPASATPTPTRFCTPHGCRRSRARPSWTPQSGSACTRPSSMCSAMRSSVRQASRPET